MPLQRCGRCQAALQADARFCGVCGTPVWPQSDTPPGFCVSCGAPHTSSVVCNECGELLSGRVYAGFGRRLAAMVVDLIIGFGIIVVPLIILILSAGNDTSNDDPPTDEEKFGGLLIAALFGLAVWSVQLAYLWIMNARGATLGKRLLGLRVVSVEHGENIGLGPAFVRAFVWYIGTQTPFLIAWFWMLWDNKKQTLHDKAANSIVIKTP